MKYRHHYNAFTVWTDLAMCLFMWAMLLVALLIISVHVQASKTEDMHPKAEYLVTLTWDDDRDVDLDLWMRTPSGDPIFYASREAPNISLDRDARGTISNRSIKPDGSIVDSGNQEIIAIRAIIPGIYTVEVNYYGIGELKDPQIDCTVDISKVNPTVRTILHAKLHLREVKETQNVFTFRINDDGSITQLPLSQDDLVRGASRG